MSSRLARVRFSNLLFCKYRIRPGKGGNAVSIWGAKCERRELMPTPRWNLERNLLFSVFMTLLELIEASPQGPPQLFRLTSILADSDCFSADRSLPCHPDKTAAHLTKHMH